MANLFKVLCLCFLTFGVICKASPVKHAEQDNEQQRGKRQMKVANAATEQAEVKFLSAATTPIQVVPGSMNLQAGRLTPYAGGMTLQAAYAALPSLGYGLNGGLNGVNGVGGVSGGGLPFNPSSGGLGVTGSLANFPSGLELYPAYMYGGGLYPNAGTPAHGLGANGLGSLNPLDNYANLQGLSTQLLAQPSQIHAQQIAPYPGLPGFYPQMGPAFHNFQG